MPLPSSHEQEPQGSSYEYESHTPSTREQQWVGFLRQIIELLETKKTDVHVTSVLFRLLQAACEHLRFEPQLRAAKPMLETIEDASAEIRALMGLVEPEGGPRATPGSPLPTEGESSLAWIFHESGIPIDAGRVSSAALEARLRIGPILLGKSTFVRGEQTPTLLPSLPDRERLKDVSVRVEGRTLYLKVPHCPVFVYRERNEDKYDYVLSEEEVAFAAENLVGSARKVKVILYPLATSSQPQEKFEVTFIKRVSPDVHCPVSIAKTEVFRMRLMNREQDSDPILTTFVTLPA